MQCEKYKSARGISSWWIIRARTDYLELVKNGSIIRATSQIHDGAREDGCVSIQNVDLDLFLVNLKLYQIALHIMIDVGRDTNTSRDASGLAYEATYKFNFVDYML